MPNESQSTPPPTDPADASATNAPPTPPIPNAPPATEVTQPTPGTTEESGETDGGEAVFDAAKVESQYGLPPGSLKDYQSEDEAIAAIRQAIDQEFLRSTMQPLVDTQPAPIPNAPPAGQQQASQTDGQKAAADSLAALTQKVESLEAQLKQSSKAQLEATKQEVVRVASETIDSWNSPKYGTSKTRTFAQAKELKELLQYVKTHTETMQASGKQIPKTKELLDLVRLWHDPDHKPGQAQQPAGQPLGQPGNLSAAATNGAGPKNIHEAVIGSWRGR
jgi:hypothetical protein